MAEPLVLRAHFMNALLPRFLPHLLLNLVNFSLLYLLLQGLQQVFAFAHQNEILLFCISLTVAFSFFKVAKDVIRVLNTRYKFYDDHVEEHYKFFKEATHSVPYSHVTNIEVTKTVWDRLCGVGNIVIHTGNEEVSGAGSSVTLYDLRHPEEIKQQIMARVNG